MRTFFVSRSVLSIFSRSEKNPIFRRLSSRIYFPKIIFSSQDAIRSFSSVAASFESIPQPTQYDNCGKNEAKVIPNVSLAEGLQKPKTWIIMELKRDAPGSLNKALEVINKYGVNMMHIESRLKSFAREGPSFHIDFEGSIEDPTIVEMLKDLRCISSDLVLMPPRDVPWFAMNIRDLDITTDVIDGGDGLINEDHPGFHDHDYRKRRTSIVESAKGYRHGQRIDNVVYTKEELETWKTVFDTLRSYHSLWACDEYNKVFPLLEKHCGFRSDHIPQLQDISDFLQQQTGFSLRPIPGLLSPRDFLNALAFRVFYSTQYIRHHGNPFYTPEPDIVHELIGHVPLFADPDFADFSQDIGLASLGASDADIQRLSSLYWFTVEFGVLSGPSGRKAYGAGLLSSFGELEWSCSDEPSEECMKMGSLDLYKGLTKPRLVTLEPMAAAVQPYPITSYQPVYFCASSISEARDKISQFCDEGVTRLFFPQYDPLTQSIRVTRSVRRLPRENESMLSETAEKQRLYFERLEQSKEDYNMKSVDTDI